MVACPAGTEAAPSPPPAAATGVERVAIVLLAPFASGAEHQTLALCRYLRARCQVTLLTNDEFAALIGSDPFLRAYTTGTEIVRLGRAFPAAPARAAGGALRRLWLYPGIQVALWRALRCLRPDVVHLVLAPSFFAYLPFFHAIGLPVVITLAGEMRYARHYYGSVKRGVVRLAAGLADSLVVCSADELANLAAMVPAAIPKAMVLDNFTDVARFAPAPEKERRVTFAARLHPEKGTDLFLEAVSRVRARCPDAQFALMGRGELDGEVQRQIEALGLGDVVERGFATDLAPYFARSLVFVSCQRHENLGSSSLLEAMAAGNAVVATDVGQTRLIVDESVGRRVPPTVEALAEAIGDLLEAPAQARRLGLAARARVLDHYGPHRYVERLMRVYAAARRQRAGRLPARLPLR